ncbi:beta 1,3 galactosyltransferase, putative [Ixodes scapularis]|uniref:Hexosyltransferase n=1 Tax=Ixodes scapularis TaxID=6945 RepID=B7Q864_IXOSC|nr:beta 1,3 galactosyltransferase, putative [Ixodes scapularis]|eukprot:XP_002412298.1 beta 1,3 galactosyltransferase, putative [Ixodes scapularis]
MPKLLRRRAKLMAAIVILIMALLVTERGFGYFPLLQQEQIPLRWFDGSTISAEELRNTRVYNEPSSYTMNPVNLCQTNSSSLDYLFLIPSAADHFEHRRAIRETWGKELRQFSGIRLAFLLGQPQDSELQSALLLESLEHVDLIQGDFQDTYNNMTVKIVMMMHWAIKYCSHIKFLIRMDDDGVLNVPNFFKAIVLKPQNAMYGLLVHNMKIIRDLSHKNAYTEEDFPRPIAPDFLAGAMIIIGSETLMSLYKGTGHVTPVRSDDVYLAGMVAERVGVPLVHQAGIHYWKQTSPCDQKKAIFYQDMSPTEMREAWFNLQRTVHKCYELPFHFHFCFCRTLEKLDGIDENSLL